MTKEARGPVILREKPPHRLVDMQAYYLPDECTPDDFQGAAAWVRFHGGEVKLCDSEGLLVVSRYTDTDGNLDGTAFHEWIGESSLIVFDPQHPEFTVYGSGMADRYELVQPTAEEIGK